MRTHRMSGIMYIDLLIMISLTMQKWNRWGKITKILISQWANHETWDFKEN